MFKSLKWILREALGAIRDGVFWKRSIGYIRRNGFRGLLRAFVVHVRAILLDVASNGAPSYSEWRECFGHSEYSRSAIFRRLVLGFKRRPKISVLIPVYNTKASLLRETLDSVLAQIYENWEICIVDDCSDVEETLAVLNEYQLRVGSRFKMECLDVNEHIAGATNRALDLASGEYILLLDHDDLLTKDAMFWVVKEINNEPDVAMIYSDEDKVSEDCRNFYDPYFKPDWNYELILGQNYINHLAVYNTQIARKIGGFRSDYNGAQDWDFILRYTELINEKQIRHIPRILYHWRASATSTAVSVSGKGYALDSGKRAVRDHLFRIGRPAEVTVLKNCPYLRIKYQLVQETPFVSIIIPTKNGYELLSACIDSILKRTTYENFELLIIDNGSTEDSTLAYFEKLKGLANVRIVRDDSPFNFSRINNRASRLARGSFLLFLNNDIEIISGDWLEEMVSRAIQPKVGIVGAKLLYQDNTIQHGGIVLVGGVAGHAHRSFPSDSLGYFGRAALAQDFVAVTGACLLVRKEFFFEVGGFDEELAVAFNDVDFCLKVFVKGYRTVWTPFARIYHYESKSRGYENTVEKQKRFDSEVLKMKRRWGALLENDPFLNPNLSNMSERFELTREPRIFY